MRARLEGYGRGEFGPWRAAARARRRRAKELSDHRLRTSGADGTCVFEGLPPDPWVFELWRDEASPRTTVEVPAGGDVALQLRTLDPR